MGSTATSVYESQSYPPLGHVLTRLVLTAGVASPLLTSTMLRLVLMLDREW
jgi:hypothetical protein